MKRRLLTLTVAMGVMLGLTVPVTAADLHPNQDDGAVYCTTYLTQLHFVHVQHGAGSSASDTITVVFSKNADGSGGTDVQVVASSKSNGGTIHYYVSPDPGFPYLQSASDTIAAGKIVLSDAKCKGKGKLVGLD